MGNSTHTQTDIEKMHKDIEEGETNQLYICIIVKPLLHLIL